MKQASHHDVRSGSVVGRSILILAGVRVWRWRGQSQASVSACA